MQSVDPGFGREPTAILTFLTPATRFSPDEARVYTRRLLDRFRELPGVDAVGAISRLHLNPLSTRTSDFNVAGFEPPGVPGIAATARIRSFAKWGSRRISSVPNAAVGTGSSRSSA